MTLLWFAVWLIADLIGDREPLLLDPVNFWAGALLLSLALDVSSAGGVPRPEPIRRETPCPKFSTRLSTHMRRPRG